MPSGKLFVPILSLVLGLALVVLYWQMSSRPKSPAANVPSLTPAISKTQISSTPTPTPIPFADMTIPYLRQKDFASQLSELQPLAQNSLYSSYLTSYTSDGLKINGLLTKPNGQQPPGGWPAIVFVHGYVVPTTYQTTERYVDYVDYLAKSGFVVFKIDLRGHGSSEGQPGGGYYTSDYVIDTLSAYSALQNSSFVNPQKIGLWGHSMAGNILLRSWAVKPEIKAVVIWAGAGYTYLDLRDYGITDNSYRPPPNDSELLKKRQQMFQLYGSPDPNSPFWKQVIPTNYLSDIKGAIQLDQAQDDQTVSLKYNQNLNQILDKTQIPHQFLTYPSGGHNISPPSFDSAMSHTVEFFHKYLD